MATHTGFQGPGNNYRFSRKSLILMADGVLATDSGLFGLDVVPFISLWPRTVRGVAVGARYPSATLI
jgi:hypothetical protein